MRSLIARIRAAAAPHGRQPRFSLSLRPVLAETEEKAWAKADAILEQARALNRRNRVWPICPVLIVFTADRLNV